MEKLFRFNE